MTRFLFLFSLLFIANSVLIAQNCSYTITPGQLYVDASKLNIQPGDTICIQAGEKACLKLLNFHGSPTKYIVFKNSGGVVVVKNSNMTYGISINNSSYFRLTGTGSSTDKYGIKVMGTTGGASGLGVGDGSTNFEVDHIEVANTGFAGIFSKTDPVCDLSKNRDNFTQYQSIYHDNYIHNTGGEGMYIGHSFYSGWTTTCNGLKTILYPSVLKGVRVYNNIVDNAGWDGIQVSSATEDCEIYGNTITNYGVAGVYAQHSGIEIGGGTVGKCYNNSIVNGTGDGIDVFGLGNNEIYNNIIVNAGRNYYPNDSTQRVHGIFCDDRGTIPGSSFKFYNNTIVNPKSDGIRFMSTLSKKNLFYNNIVVQPGNLLSYSKYSKETPYINIGSMSGVDAIISNNYFNKDIANVFFVDALNNNYRLASNSPAIDAGMDLSGLGLNYDFDRHIRPFGIGYDIGAFESQVKKVVRNYIMPDQLNVDAANMDTQPGDTVFILASTKKYLRLVNFHGSPSKYIIFKNVGGSVIIQNNDMSYGLKIGNSSYFRFTGTGVSDIKYGIKVMGTSTTGCGLSVDDGSTNFEVDHVEVANAGAYAGILSKTNTQCDLSTNRENFTQYQSVFHDNYIHNSLGEGMIIGHLNYLGLTTTCNGQSSVLYPSVLKGVRIYNNIVEDSNLNGIRVTSATEDCEIYGNTITNYGLIKGVVPQNGILMGTGTTGKCYNNYIANGAGTGIALNGIGGSDVYNNVIVNAGRNYYPADSTKRVYGMICGDQSTIAGRSFNFYNNTIVSPKTDGIMFSSTLSKGNKFYNNIVVNPGSLLSYLKYYPKQSPYINVGAKTGIDATISNNYFDKNMANVYFENTQNDNYRLLSNSPAIDVGINLSNLGVSYDFDYNSRPSGSLFDIGAFEYQAVNSSPLRAAAALSTSTASQKIKVTTDSLNHSIKSVTDFTVSPNPNKGVFTILRENSNSVNIKVFDLMGYVVYKENNVADNNKTINLSRIKGSFYINLSNENSSTTKIIIIQ